MGAESSRRFYLEVKASKWESAKIMVRIHGEKLELSLLVITLWLADLI